MNTLKLLSVLLGYPSAELVAAIPELARRLGEDEALQPDTRDALAGLLVELEREDLLDLQERYVAQFDTGRATSLHLFEHVHGDSRDRGQAMVGLMSLYHRAGFVLATSELPDFLPAVLEYLSTRPTQEARDVLDDCAHILRAVGERLLDHRSPYAAVFSALLDLQGEPPLIAGRSDADDCHSLGFSDNDWQETPVEFGPDAAMHGAQQSRGEFIRFVPRQHISRS
ncbi:MAG: nitrate reductase molybdenum cofactor assembly chaperone [Betaproteobacteria bacterium RIFCSPLOWO2_12_FULL_63_13]|nr:MAG: nitrate reductase molybdenum cofactor assembly chaperone [Betaproteobacteria bacterium RIFCSPLOWO2_02_FULL_63_19]OGA42761.1 MAG: nitrate reductase molybdenum cofactor assembly chaperone [Betaproteobacteria bacterium RIFCSPLOWO2_12_FULL_63_13]